MKHNHLGNVAEFETCPTGALSPFHVFREVYARKWADFREVRASYDEVAGAGKAMLFDVQLETVRKYALVGFNRGKYLSIVPDANVAAENGSLRRRLQIL